MFDRPSWGAIEIICGSMFSGKTEELLRRLKRAHIARQKIQVFKPQIDNRYSLNHVQSHDAGRMLSLPVKDSKEVLSKLENNTRVVGIDEVQFFDNEIVKAAQEMAYRGIRVICAGLDLDFKGEPFGPMPTLLAIAESVTKLSAVCVVCGRPASRTQRTIAQAESPPSDEQILVGSTEFYEARCRFCHEPRAIELSGGQMGLFPKTNSIEKKKAEEGNAR